MNSNRKKWNTLITVALSALTAGVAPSSFAQGGNGVGNGGLAYICRDAAGKITRAELLDLWEPETYKIERSNASIEEQIEMAIDRITMPFRQTKKTFSASLKAMQGKVLMTDRKLHPTEDALPNFTPEPGCAYEQVARYDLVNDLGQMRLLINREIFESVLFSNTDRAALFVHETVYEIYVRKVQAARALAEEYLRRYEMDFPIHEIRRLAFNSRLTRQIVQAVFHDPFAVVSREDLISGLRWILSDGFSVLAPWDSDIVFQDSRSVTIATLPLQNSRCDFTLTDLKDPSKRKELTLQVEIQEGVAEQIRRKEAAHEKVRRKGACCGIALANKMDRPVEFLKSRQASQSLDFSDWALSEGPSLYRLEWRCEHPAYGMLFISPRQPSDSYRDTSSLDAWKNRDGAPSDGQLLIVVRDAK